MGDIEKSLWYLERSTGRWYHPPLDADPDFEVLRGRPEYEAIVAETKQRAGVE
jgi:hypothetical protein